MSPYQNLRRQLKRRTPIQKPPAYWDNLSYIWLTKSALRELQRRVRYPQPSERPSRSATALLQHCTPDCLKEIKRLSRLGGPDLSDLRGYPPPGADFHDGSMAPTKPGPQNEQTGQSPTDSTPTSTPYSRNFEQNLIDHQVYPPMYRYRETRTRNEPDNMGEIRERLAAHRPSLSPSNFSEAEYEKFKTAYWDAPKESQVTASVVPLIEGNISQYTGGGYPFNNLAPLTDGTLSHAEPDIFYGAHPEQLNRDIRNDLMDKIIPATDDSLPMAPNFFLEVKGSDGNHAVAKRQAWYNGALGSRAIHALQSYQSDESHNEKVYDNNAYTITSTYATGTLSLFTFHLTKPTSPDGRPEYFMTPLRSFAIADSLESFREGATAYRNARDWTKEKRDKMITLANGRLSEAHQRTTGEAQHENASSGSQIKEVEEDV